MSSANGNASQLDVLIGGRHVGTLRRTARGGRFTYDADIVASQAGLPLLSASLPVKAREYAEGKTGAWFEGLLPEGDRLNRICRELQLPTWDYLGVLSAIGWECAGAVQVLPQGEQLASPLKEVQPLSVIKLAQKLSDLTRAVGLLDATTRVSLGGYQDKLCVVAQHVTAEDGRVTGATWGLPSPAAMSTHIIKPQPHARFPHLIEGEAWAMTVASHAARCAQVALLELEGAPQTLLIKRFDRLDEGDAAPHRIHQEDCCQALGISPAGKYASAQGVKGNDPTYLAICDILNRYAADPHAEKAELLRQLVVNLALGNTDAHAKNYSLLYRRPGVPSLSPLYDVTPVLDIEPRADHLSMRVGGQIAASRVGRPEVLAEAQSWGLSDEEAIDTIDATLSSMQEGLRAARAWHPDAASRHEASTLARMEALAHPKAHSAIDNARSVRE